MKIASILGIILIGLGVLSLAYFMSPVNFLGIALKSSERFTHRSRNEYSASLVLLVVTLEENGG